MLLPLVLELRLLRLPGKKLLLVIVATNSLLIRADICVTYKERPRYGVCGRP
jgi:hypothetical protein